MPPRIAILCSDDAHHDYLIETMRTQFNVVLVCREPGALQRRRIRRHRRWRDYAYATYHHWRRSLLGLNRYRRRYFAMRSPAAAPIDPALTVWVADINAPDVIARVTEARPDLTIVMGTSILKQAVLTATGAAVINIHGGCLPDYRGNHCFFFALYHRDFDRIASTIHFVDRNIDTGDIIEHVVPEIRPDDNAEALYCRAEKMAIHRLADLLQHWHDGTEIPRHPQPYRGHLYLTRDRHPGHDLHHAFRCVTGLHRRALDDWRRRRSGSNAYLALGDPHKSSGNQG